jgi:hypothetical protein
MVISYSSRVWEIWGQVELAIFATGVFGSIPTFSGRAALDLERRGDRQLDPFV